MSKITNDGLTLSGTGCFIAAPNPYGNSGRQRVNVLDGECNQFIAPSTTLMCGGSTVRDARGIVEPSRLTLADSGLPATAD